MDTADERLSRGMQELGNTLDAILLAIVGKRVPFILVAAPEREAHYLSSVARPDAVLMLRGLLARWDQKADLPDLPPHQKEELLLELLVACKSADQQISATHAAFGAPGDYGYESREGKALYELYKFQVELRAAISEAGAAIAFSRELSANGTIAPPPAGERN